MKFKFLVLAALLLLCLFPTLAQNSANNVTFNGFSFTFDSSLASNVDISQYPGDPADAQVPGGPEVRHTQFALYNGLISFDENTRQDIGGIRVYNAADLAGYDSAVAQLQQLQTLLAERPDLSSFMAVSDAPNQLPYLPVVAGTEVIRARARFVDTAAVSGISYVTVLRLDVSPILSQEFIYTFQGLSSDGTYYVSAVFHINAGMFPSEYPGDFDFAAFDAQFTQYLTDSTAQLNDAAPEDFTPTLTVLDAVVQSITFTGTSAPTTSPTPAATEPAENTDPTMGGLAGINWTLVSYGSPDAPVAVLPEAPITAAFSASGVSGSAGCNTYNAPFQFNGNALTFGEIIRTEIACADPVNAQEAAFLTALATASTFQIANGQMQITYNGGVLTFRDATLINTPLEGNWTLVSYGSADAPTPVLPEAPITLAFAASQVSGNAGCNSYSGTVQVENNTMTFGAIVSTLMACVEEPRQTQETAYLNALRTASTFQIANGQLQIFYDGGVLTFAPVS